MPREYNEVIEILNYIPREDYNKIPTDLIGAFKKNIEKDYKFKYDIKRTLKEQNVSKEARTIIAILFRDYWATDKQREKILAKEKNDIKKMEKEARKKYNPNDIFNNIKNDEKTMRMVEVKEKENIIHKILNKIKLILKRKK